MSYDSDYDESGELETAIAAASFAIFALEEAELQNSQTKTTGRNEVEPAAAFAVATVEEPSLGQTKSTKHSRAGPLESSLGQTKSTKDSQAGPLEWELGEASKRTAENFNWRPPENIITDQKMREAEPINWRSPENTLTDQKMQAAVAGNVKVKTKADAREKAAMAKIRKRYEKQSSMILTWNNEEKEKVRQRFDKKERRLNLRKEMATQAYEYEVEKIDKVAREARELAEERQRNDESKIKEKARKIKSTVKVPVKCLCF